MQTNQRTEPAAADTDARARREQYYRDIFLNWAAPIYVRDNWEFYQRKWQGKTMDTDAGWNWAAFFLGPTWALYRKLYALAIGITLVGWILPVSGWVVALGAYMAGSRKAVEVANLLFMLGRFMPLVCGGYMGGYGNRHYRAKVHTQVQQALREGRGNRNTGVHMHRSVIQIGIAPNRAVFP